MWSNKYNKIKDIVKEIVDKSLQCETKVDVLKKDIILIESYIKFSIEKRVESLLAQIGATKEDQQIEISIDTEELNALKSSLWLIFEDRKADLDINSEKRELIQSFQDELNMIIIKALNKLTPLCLIEDLNENIFYSMMEEDLQDEQLKLAM